MGKDHFSDYFKIHDEIHLRYTEFIFQNLTFWKKKSFYFGWRISRWYMYTHDRSCAHSRLAVSFTILTLQNISKMHFPVKYLKFWRKNFLIGFCILCTFFQINISVPKLSLKHLPLKYDFITINIFIWVANKTLIQKK